MPDIDPFKAQREERWLPVILWMGLIYSTAALVRPVCEFLRGMTLLNVTVTVLMSGFLLLFAGQSLVSVKHLKPSRIFLLFVTLGFYIAGMVLLKIPEERVHLLEYGVLAYLVFRALRVDFRKSRCYVGTVIVGFLLGWIDEIIQSFSPGRYYDNRDVVINGISVCLGLLLIFVAGKDDDEIYITE